MSMRVTVRTKLDVTQADTLVRACKRYCESVSHSDAAKTLTGSVKRHNSSKHLASFVMSLTNMEISHSSEDSWVKSRLNEFYQAQKIREEAEGMGRLVEESVTSDGDIVMEVEYA